MYTSVDEIRTCGPLKCRVTNDRQLQQHPDPKVCTQVLVNLWHTICDSYNTRYISELTILINSLYEVTLSKEIEYKSALFITTHYSILHKEPTQM